MDWRSSGSSFPAKADSSSFLMRNPDWKPTLPAEKPGMFTMADLLRFVGDINPLG